MNLIIEYPIEVTEMTTVHIYNIHINQTYSSTLSEPNPGFIVNATQNEGHWNNEEFRIQTPFSSFKGVLAKRSFGHTPPHWVLCNSEIKYPFRREEHDTEEEASLAARKYKSPKLQVLY